MNNENMHQATAARQRELQYETGSLSRPAYVHGSHPYTGKNHFHKFAEAFKAEAAKPTKHHPIDIFNLGKTSHVGKFAEAFKAEAATP